MERTEQTGAAPEPGEHEPGVSGGPGAEPVGPRPLGVDVRPTGHAEVDAGLTRLADADRLAVEDHLAVYEDVHRGLRSTLTALDQHDPGS
ncbi:hypothetical protein GCM10023347_15420 [Streptomyces chumphonensis]|uniref:hypothetical protein n=1 Tax=Streptomyces chumphonensis TaxID=1214925 RepID=UPI001CD11828|nr:hypothetical protein [Streptomyces chumphonensis]